MCLILEFLWKCFFKNDRQIIFTHYTVFDKNEILEIFFSLDGRNTTQSHRLSQYVPSMASGVGDLGLDRTLSRLPSIRFRPLCSWTWLLVLRVSTKYPGWWAWCCCNRQASRKTLFILDLYVPRDFNNVLFINVLACSCINPLKHFRINKRSSSDPTAILLKFYFYFFGRSNFYLKITRNK